MHPSREFGALVTNSTTCDVASTYWTGILCSDVHRPHQGTVRIGVDLDLLASVVASQFHLV